MRTDIMTIKTFTRNIKRLMFQLKNDKRGSVAIISALAMVAIVGFVGLSVETVRMTETKTRFDKAAEAAAIAAVNYAVTNGSSAYGWDTRAAAAGKVVFNNNIAGNGTNGTTPTVNITPTVSGTTISATAAYSATLSATLGTVVGVSTFTVTGSATASQAASTNSSYINFYILMDTSDSMSIPASKAEQTTLYGKTSCVFACHGGGPGLPGGYNSFHDYAKNGLGLKIRQDVATSALAYMISQAAAAEGGVARYKFGLWTFATGASSTTSTFLQQIYPLTSNLSTLSTNIAAGTGIPDPTYGLSTSIKEALDFTYTNIINRGGSGTAADPYNYVILVTDGVVDNQQAQSMSATEGWDQAKPAGETFSAMESAWCSTLKGAGVKIATLNVVYPSIPSSFGLATSGDQSRLNYFVTGQAIPTDVDSNMQACASSPTLYAKGTVPTTSSETDPLYAAALSIFTTSTAATKITQLTASQ